VAIRLKFQDGNWGSRNRDEFRVVERRPDGVEVRDRQDVGGDELLGETENPMAFGVLLFGHLPGPGYRDEVELRPGWIVFVSSADE